MDWPTYSKELFSHVLRANLVIIVLGSRLCHTLRYNLLSVNSIKDELANIQLGASTQCNRSFFILLTPFCTITLGSIFFLNPVSTVVLTFIKELY